MIKRKNIKAQDIPEHKNPIPVATKIGNMIFTSAIGGEDPESHKLPIDRLLQIRNVFLTITAIMREAGGSPENIGKVNVYLIDMQDRKLVNQEWIKMFPDESSRPARHTMIQDLPSGRYIQVEFLAII